MPAKSIENVHNFTVQQSELARSMENIKVPNIDWATERHLLKYLGFALL